MDTSVSTKGALGSVELWKNHRLLARNNTEARASQAEVVQAIYDTKCPETVLHQMKTIQAKNHRIYGRTVMLTKTVDFYHIYMLI